jgi:hypothetical protein
MNKPRDFVGSTVLVVLVLLASIVTTAQIAIRPGQYEFTVDMKMDGIPADAPKAVLDAAGFTQQKKLECLTPEDVKGGVANMLAREMGDAETCKQSDVKTTGNKLTFTLICVDDGVRTVINSEMVFVGDSFTGVATSKDNKGNAATVKTSAKRVGECK